MRKTKVKAKATAKVKTKAKRMILLHLPVEDAGILSVILAYVGGDIEGPRASAGHIGDVLREAGFDWEDYDRLYSVAGAIIINER